MNRYMCEVCGWVYKPDMGDPFNGVEPGTPFEDIPDGWLCPQCGVPKSQFIELD